MTLTHTGAVADIQPLPNGEVLFTRSSLTSPNDVFVLRNIGKIDLESPDAQNQANRVVQAVQLTKFTADALSSKTLSEGEDFWFEGSENRTIHGWIIKPKGFEKGERKKWPGLLIIHGGWLSRCLVSSGL